MLPEIEEYVSEDDLWEGFELAHPRLLGALLDVVSEAMRREPEVKLEQLPRMADFARWIAAAAPAFGWDAKSCSMPMHTTARRRTRRRSRPRRWWPPCASWVGARVPRPSCSPPGSRRWVTAIYAGSWNGVRERASSAPSASSTHARDDGDDGGMHTHSGDDTRSQVRVTGLDPVKEGK